MEFEKHNIECKTFWDVERVIKNAEAKIKEPRTAAEKRYYAQDILLESNTLLFCPDYNARNSDCVDCHSAVQQFIRKYDHIAKDGRKGVVKRY